MVKYYNGEMFVIPKEFEEEIRADEREKCKCPYWNEEHQECATSFEEDIRADERAKVLDEFKSSWDKRVKDLINWCKDKRLIGLQQADSIFDEIVEQLKEERK